MKKRLQHMFIMLLALPLWGSCLHEPEYANTPESNFEVCWQILNDRYWFFKYKDIDWREVHDRYESKVTPDMPSDSLFEVLNKMLQELKDGHVNIYNSFNIGRYWDWFEAYPDNFDERIQRNYLGTDYAIAGGLKYKILADSIGYVYYSSFSSPVSHTNLDYVLYKFKDCKGLIFDVRHNGGGAVSLVNRIASHFTSEKVLSGYMQHKTGKGHADFSEPYPTYLEPASERLRWFRKTVVLANRHTYSAANNFVSVMRVLPQVVVVGDRTGGGSGFPFSSELPNGWGIRFSSSPIFDAFGQQTEFGIEPDIPVTMSSESMAKGLDDIIEMGKKVILNEVEYQLVRP